MSTLEGLVGALYAHYGPQGWWPLLEPDRDTGVWRCVVHPGEYSPADSPLQRFEIGVGAILTQNSSWSGALAALLNLRNANLLCPDCIADTKLSATIQTLVRCSGFFRQKQERLANWARFCIELGPASPGRSDLLALNGIGPETADSILLYAYGQPLFVADAYALRTAARFSGLPWCYTDLARFMAEQTDRLSAADRVRMLNEAHALFVAHGKRFCRARPKCAECFLKDRCQLGRNLRAGT